jgi:hypothetical protein
VQVVCAVSQQENRSGRSGMAALAIPASFNLAQSFARVAFHPSWLLAGANYSGSRLLAGRGAYAELKTPC